MGVGRVIKRPWWKVEAAMKTDGTANLLLLPHRNPCQGPAFLIGVLPDHWLTPELCRYRPNL